MKGWITNFVKACAPTASPEPYLKWAAISAVAGVMGRNTWTYTLGSRLYPNMYTVLVGPPGVGKSEITDRVRGLWTQTPYTHMAASNISRAGLVDQLNEAKSGLSNCLLICSNELGVLLPQYDTEFMAVLTDLYDGRIYSERKRGGTNMSINEPQFNLLASCTPGYLQRVFPEPAWEEGFCSRTLFIYYGGLEKRSLFNLGGGVELGSLIEELKLISNLKGEFGFTSEAADWIDNWHMGGNKPKPSHPKLVNYCTRRTVHALKLAMVFSASRSLDLQIKLEDVQGAVRCLVEAEGTMEEIFKAMTSGGDTNVMKEACHFIYKYELERNKLVSETLLQAYLGDRVDVWKIKQIIELMTSVGVIKQVKQKGANHYKYIGNNKAF